MAHLGLSVHYFSSTTAESTNVGLDVTADSCVFWQWLRPWYTAEWPSCMYKDNIRILFQRLAIVLFVERSTTSFKKNVKIEKDGV